MTARDYTVRTLVTQRVRATSQRRADARALNILARQGVSATLLELDAEQCNCDQSIALEAEIARLLWEHET